ncbi:uncharacterized protein LOC108628033 isoform X2 [Ceratina calcarata]|uniref:Uncharacterized protein LOC108628033 isoform X2 n=1 Tax=Ceratina calcarata TaxID=156304 RepID=A0AAJ7J5D7_9HYME|nr:uncharacterized protein LOC108628033 isoform X2 [Ceratina calcarata]
MYSLYRAWFGDSVTADNYSRLQETLSPPDTVVRVGNEGEHQFVAHKGVLAAHSGYLKALLTNAASTPSPSVNTSFPATIAVTATNLSGQSTRQPVTSVSVSSIGGEAFAPLLDYMYTGRLEVTLDNVYSVLLATHLLHMPGALEQCRAALLRLRAPPLPTPIPVPQGPTSTLTSSSSMPASTTGPGNILRPIPNRLMIDPSMCWPPLYPPTAPPPPGTIGISHLPQLQPSVLMQSAVPLSVSIVPTSIQETQSSTVYSDISPKSSMFQVERNRGLRMDIKGKPSSENASNSHPFAAYTTSNVVTSTRTSSPCQSISPTPSSTSQSSIAACQSRKPTENRARKEEPDYEEQNENPRTQRLGSPLAEDSRIPRSHDKNSDTGSVGENDRGRGSKRRGRGSSNSGNDGPSSILSVVYDVACCDGPVKFHRVLNENYSSTAGAGSGSRLQRPCFEPENNASSENDENGGPAGSVRTTCDPSEPRIDAGNGTGGSYTCGYCRHTFKSQYCYRKHTKRHLLSIRTNDSIGNRQRQETVRNRREVRLLDLNVQYYPCKICGCKFPSYYFVHKHRKLCHANREERSQSDEANSIVPEDQESTTSTTNNERQ